MNTPSHNQLSDAEWTVMNAVWQLGTVTVRDVFEVVEKDTGWAYSTVKTLLGRLVDKGALSTSKRGNTSLFEPLLERRTARGQALKTLVRRAFGGTFDSLVHHLLDDEHLSVNERRELEDMMAREGLSDVSPDQKGADQKDADEHDAGNEGDPGS